jgi:hypothetical protein
MSTDHIGPEEIGAFLKDLATAEVKLGMKNSLNVFEAAGLARQETKHSRMLAFLLDPAKGHCLNAEVFKGLVLKNFDSIICPPCASPVRPTRLLLDGLGDLYIDCEWKHIDVLAYSESLNLVVAIENKIDAKESSKDGTTQLQRYANILESDPKFSSYSKLFLFLTVDGEEPSDKRWTTVTHADVLNYVEEPYNAARSTGGLTTEADFFVKNYIDFLRRKIVSNPLLEEECRSIYQRHKELLDMIIEIVGVRGGVSEYADIFAQKTQTMIYANRSGKFAYLPSTLANALPDGTLDKPWWGQQKPFLFWFYINDKQRLALIFQVGPMKDKKIRKKLVDTLVEAFELDRNRKTTDQYTVILSYATTVDQENDNLLEHMLELHSKFKEKIPRLEKIVSEFNFEEK